MVSILFVPHFALQNSPSAPEVPVIRLLLMLTLALAISTPSLAADVEIRTGDDLVEVETDALGPDLGRKSRRMRVERLGLGTG